MAVPVFLVLVLVWVSAGTRAISRWLDKRRELRMELDPVYAAKQRARTERRQRLPFWIDLLLP